MMSGRTHASKTNGENQTFYSDKQRVNGEAERTKKKKTRRNCFGIDTLCFGMRFIKIRKNQ